VLEETKNALQARANQAQAIILQRFFKTAPGQYGEGDVFLGLKVPEVRKIVNECYKNLSFIELDSLLQSNIHEYRLTALLVLVKKYEFNHDLSKKAEIVDFYLKHLERANNWDLVDLSAPRILGDFLLNHDQKERAVLYDLAKSKNLWRQRVAIISTFSLIRAGQFEETLAISLMLLNHPHDLIHKAVGWMLRELGKRDQQLLEDFLQKHYQQLPRTTLRYAIEKFDAKKKIDYLRANF